MKTGSERPENPAEQGECKQGVAYPFPARISQHATRESKSEVECGAKAQQPPSDSDQSGSQLCVHPNISVTCSGRANQQPMVQRTAPSLRHPPPDATAKLRVMLQRPLGTPYRR